MITRSMASRSSVLRSVNADEVLMQVVELPHVRVLAAEVDGPRVLVELGRRHHRRVRIEVGVRMPDHDPRDARAVPGLAARHAHASRNSGGGGTSSLPMCTAASSRSSASSRRDTSLRVERAEDVSRLHAVARLHVQLEAGTGIDRVFLARTARAELHRRAPHAFGIEARRPSPPRARSHPACARRSAAARGRRPRRGSPPCARTHARNVSSARPLAIESSSRSRPASLVFGDSAEDEHLRAENETQLREIARALAPERQHRFADLERVAHGPTREAGPCRSARTRPCGPAARPRARARRQAPARRLRSS